MNQATFLRKFRFLEERAGYLAIERERFTVRDGAIVPSAHIFLAEAFRNTKGGMKRWCPELSGCQVEDHCPEPRKDLASLRNCLLEADLEAEFVRRRTNIELLTQEVAPAEMPLDPFPFNERYHALHRALPPEIYLAGCRVAGTHLHMGCRNLTEAIEVSNALRPHIDTLLQMSDKSAGERRRLYTLMAPNPYPPHYESTTHFYETLLSASSGDPRSCWHWVRISHHGTVEIRAFGATPHIEEIIAWIERVFDILGRK